MENKKFCGVYTALVTPFLNGQIDYKSLKALIKFQLDKRIQGFVVNGTTGESPTLSAKERTDLFNFVSSEVSNSVPIIMGTGSLCTETTIEQTKQAEKMGSDAVLIVTPYYNKPPQRGLIAHYKKIASSVNIPIILYNVPGRTGVNMLPETIAELSHVSNIIGIKEASGDVGFGAKIIELSKPSFLVISGDDGTYLDLMNRGGKGVISVSSHLIPSEMRGLSDKIIAGQKGVARDFDRYQELIRHLFIEANPIPVKAALKKMGVIQSAELRLPLVEMMPEKFFEME